MTVAVVRLTFRRIILGQFADFGYCNLGGFTVNSPSASKLSSGE
jgi:hypothetical protein